MIPGEEASDEGTVEGRTITCPIKPLGRAAPATSSTTAPTSAPQGNPSQCNCAFPDRPWRHGQGHVPRAAATTVPTTAIRRQRLAVAALRRNAAKVAAALATSVAALAAGFLGSRQGASGTPGA